MEARSGAVQEVWGDFWPSFRPHHSVLEGWFVERLCEHPDIVWTSQYCQARQHRIMPDCRGKSRRRSITGDPRLNHSNHCLHWECSLCGLPLRSREDTADISSLASEESYLLPDGDTFLTSSTISRVLRISGSGLIAKQHRAESAPARFRYFT